METMFNEITTKEGIKDYLFVGVKEDGSIIAYHPDNFVTAFGLLALAEKIVGEDYKDFGEGSEKASGPWN